MNCNLEQRKEVQIMKNEIIDMIASGSRERINITYNMLIKTNREFENFVIDNQKLTINQIVDKYNLFSGL